MKSYIPDVGISQTAFAEYEANRMYPPGYGKESTMTKPKLKHIAAVTRTQHLLSTGMNEDSTPELRKSIEEDVQTLREVREILYEIMQNPTLPFTVSTEPEAVPVLNQIEDEPNEAD